MVCWETNEYKTRFEDQRVKAQEGGLRIYSRLPRKLAGKNNHNDTQVHLKEPQEVNPASSLVAAKSP
jgi:hypothetical protein